LVFFEDRSEFQAAVPQLTTEGFNTDFGDDAATVDFGAFTVAALGGVGNGLIRWSSDDQWKTEGEGAIFAADFTVPVSLDFTTRFTFDEGIRGFGIDIRDVNGPTRLLLRIDSALEFELLPPDGGEDVRRELFVGLFSDKPISQIDFAWNRAQDGIGFDFLQYTTVPEPGSLFLLAIMAAISMHPGFMRSRLA
jgi:hypothetical protein